MTPTRARFTFLLALCLATGSPARAQPGGTGAANDDAQAEPVKPTGPAAKKADEAIRSYTVRIEQEIAQARKEVDRLRAELHELIDVRYEMSAAIVDLRGDLAAKGSYTADPVSPTQAVPAPAGPAVPQQRPMMGNPRDLFYGLGSALPKDPTAEQREQLRKLSPRADLKRMADRLRDEVEQTRAEVDQLAYKLLELRAGMPAAGQVFGGMGGMGGGGMGVMLFGPWFGSMGAPVNAGGFR